MAEIDNFLDKTYKLDSSENFDEFMKELGVGLVTRKIGNAVSPTISMKKSDDTYTLVTDSTFKHTEISFKPGVEFTEETPDGRKVNSVVTFEGSVMTQVQKGEKNTTIVRKFSEEEVVATMTVNDVVCTRKYKRV